MTELLGHIRKPHLGLGFHLVHHLAEMFLAMMAGMMLGAFLLATALGTSVGEVRREHAVAWVLVMALDMTVPMVAVMLYRGHSWRLVPKAFVHCARLLKEMRAADLHFVITAREDLA